MFKRFTDCEKWDDPWYRNLPPPYKLLWQFMCDRCDNAGVWKVDFDAAQFFIGAPVHEEALKYFKDRVHILDPGYWLITKFVDFQFGALSGESPLHRSVLSLIEKHRVSLPYPKPSARVQVKEKVKVIDKVNTKKGVWGKQKFSVPTPEEVSSYAESISFKLDGGKFCDYYASKGWKIGNSPMRDWKAAVRTWKGKQEETYAPDGSQSRTSGIAILRAKRQAAGLREPPSQGQILAGIRNLQDVPTES